jgi:hypothetical protein
LPHRQPQQQRRHQHQPEQRDSDPSSHVRAIIESTARAVKRLERGLTIVGAMLVAGGVFEYFEGEHRRWGLGPIRAIQVQAGPMSEGELVV